MIVRSRFSIPGLGLFIIVAACAGPSQAQDPEIIPEMPGANLPIGELPPEPQPGLADVLGPQYTYAPAGPSTTLVPTPAPAAPAAPPTLSGDWFGVRSALAEEGVILRSNITNFSQGVTTGGLRERSRYGLKMDYFAILEFEKLLGWEGLYVNLHGESRFGESINFDDGAIVPANFAMQFPRPRGQASALTNMQIQQFLSPDFVVTFGKINTADGANVYPFQGGYGTDRFMNTSFVLNPAYGRAIPYSTPGAGFSYLRNLDPIFTFLVVDPTGRPDTPGIKKLFNNGISLFAQLRLPVTIAELPGHQGFEAAYSTGKFSSLGGDDYVDLPSIILEGLPKETGTWAVSYTFDQFLAVDPENPRSGWGVFGNLTLTDGQPNPIRWFANLGVAGKSPLPGRDLDTFGLAYYYLGLSNELKTLVENRFPLRNEQVAELFYSAPITPWFFLTLDLQAIDPGRLDAESSLLLGFRGKIVF